MAGTTQRPGKVRAALGALVLGGASAAGVQGADYTVSSSAEFAQAIVDINADPTANHRIIFSQDIALAGQPRPIVLTSGSLTVVGNNHAISGNGQYRPFFVESGEVALEDLSITNGRAQGGAGGGGGGGGLGAGGAVFVDEGASLRLKNVDFSGNAAFGGTGGAGSLGSGGGGGIGGAGGTGVIGGGAGGGGGQMQSGGASTNTDGGGGGGTTSPGASSSSGGAGADGAGDGGTAGNSGAPGTKGGGGGAGFGGDGGAGGRYGGGGGSAVGIGGDGGRYGGGGAGLIAGGNGGFGGGGGGAFGDIGGTPGVAGVGGFGGGAGGTAGGTADFGAGGGGAAFGGALFVASGAQITFEDSLTWSGNTVTAGYSLGDGGSGSTDGIDLYVMSGVSTTFHVDAGETLNLAQAIGNDDGLNVGVELTKTGEGTLSLSGASPLVSTTHVNEGTLAVNGTLGSFDFMSGRISQLEIDAAGTLSGTGTVQGYVDNYGRVAPGNAPGDIGTLTVNGVYLQGSEGVYEIDINAAGQSDLIAVTYAAQLSDGAGTDGGDLFVRAQPGDYVDGQRYTILTTGFGLFDTFGQITMSGLPYFWTASAEYDAFNAYLVLNNDGLTQYAETRNQIRTAAAVMKTSTTTDPSLDRVYNAMSGMTGAGKQAALDQLSGELYGTLASAGIQGTTAWLGELGDRLRPVVGNSAAGGQGLATTQALRTLEAPAAQASHLQFASLDRRERVRASGTNSVPIINTSGASGTQRPATENYGWVGGYGLGGDVRSDGNAQGFNYGVGGAVFGVDRQLSDDVVAGFAGGYAGSHVKIDSGQQSAQVDSLQVAPYFRRMFGPGYLFGVAGYSHDDYQSTRRLPAAVTARGDYTGNQFSTYLEGGATYALNSWNVQPLMNLQYIALQQNGFTETGAGAAGLKVRSSVNDSLRPGVGLRVARPTVAGGMIVVPDVHARYAYELLDPDRLVTANLGGVVGNGFVTAGNQLGRNFGLYGLGLNTAFTSSVGGYLGYDAITSDRSISHAGSGGLQVAW